MKKILFNDRYGLTEAVIEGRKTMTRRMVRWDILEGKKVEDIDFAVSTKVLFDGRQVFFGHDAKGDVIAQCVSGYHVGEEVAVAQRYKDIYPKTDFGLEGSGYMTESAGWTNKLFVRVDLMPYRIRIIDIRVERLQDISDIDAIREGVYQYKEPPRFHESDLFSPWPPTVKPYKHDIDNLVYRCSAYYAFSYLIDKVFGDGTWRRNPWVFAYLFEPIR